MSAAAINDVVAWVLLALAVAITNAESSPLIALWVLLLGLTFLALMFLVVSPITYALAHYKELPPEPVVAMTLVLVLGAAFLTDLIGIHVIFGAFVCGLIVPKDGPFAGTASICPLLNIYKHSSSKRGTHCSVSPKTSSFSWG